MLFCEMNHLIHKNMLILKTLIIEIIVALRLKLNTFLKKHVLSYQTTIYFSRRICDCVFRDIFFLITFLWFYKAFIILRYLLLKMQLYLIHIFFLSRLFVLFYIAVENNLFNILNNTVCMLFLQFWYNIWIDNSF